MKQEIIVNVTGNELIVREGQALPLKEPVAYRFSGDLKCVRAYLEKHKEEPDLDNWIDPMTTVISVNRKEMWIKLEDKPQSAYGTVITGKLETSDEINKFSINGTKTYGRKEFVDLLRFNRIYFSDMDVHGKLLAAVQTMTVKNSQELSASSDNRGSKAVNWNKKVNSEGIPEQFILSVPLFRGFENVKINVEVCLDVSENTVIFWLESVELAELLVTKRDELMDKELKGLADTYVVMFQ